MDARRWLLLAGSIVLGAAAVWLFQHERYPFPAGKRAPLKQAFSVKPSASQTAPAPAPPDASNDPCAALLAIADAGARLDKEKAVTDARAVLDCIARQPLRHEDLARASLTLGLLLGRTKEAVGLLKTAAADPAVKLPALDALAALRPIDAEAGCAAAIEALVREPSDARERAAKGCGLPRLH